MPVPAVIAVFLSNPRNLVQITQQGLSMISPDKHLKSVEGHRVAELHGAVSRAEAALNHKFVAREVEPKDNLSATLNTLFTFTRIDERGKTAGYPNKELRFFAYIGIVFVYEVLNYQPDEIAENLILAVCADPETAKKYIDEAIIEAIVPSKPKRSFIKPFLLVTGIIIAIIIVIAIIFALQLPSPAPNTKSQQSGPVVASTATNTTTPISSVTEKLSVRFANGISSVTTSHAYMRMITITVTGVAKSGTDEFADAFYFYGNPLNPRTHNTNFTLYIDGKPIDKFVKQIPAYRTNHTYTFTITAPGGPLTFGVGSGLAVDTTGSFTIIVSSN